MEFRFLGKTGVRVSQLGFGTMSFGGDADREVSRALFVRCRDAGINLFDCANVYAGGRSEEILGELIADCRDEVVVTSKAYFPMGRDGNARGTSRFHLVRAVEDSLRRLRTDRIDVYFLHRFDDETDLEDSLRSLEMLVKQGKILYPAVSNFAAWQAARAVGLAESRGWAPIACIQPMYNLVKRQAEVEILPMARALGVGVCSYSPLGGGLLTGKYGVDARPESGRLIDNPMYSTRYAAANNYRVAAGVAELARELSVHPVSLAVAWVNSRPGITCPILGARNVEQLEPALASVELDLAADTLTRLDQLSPPPPPATDRNEETSDHNYGAR